MYRENGGDSPKAVHFTQEDPIGLAGGMNLYGYANANPISFIDPFGHSACDPEDDPGCQTQAQMAVAAFKQWFTDALNKSITVAGAIGNYFRREGPGIIAEELAFASVGPVVGAIRNGRRVAAVANAAQRFLSESRHLRNASIGPRHAWEAVGLSADGVVEMIVTTSRWETLASDLPRGSIQLGEVIVDYAISQNRSNSAEWVLNAWIRP